jgi:hypothetical protein
VRVIKFHCFCCGSLQVLPDETADKTIPCPQTNQRVRVVGWSPYTESDWLQGENTRVLLEYLHGTRASPRKLRLLAAACCRRYWDRLPSHEFREAVLAAEGFADGEVTYSRLAIQYQAVTTLARTFRPSATPLVWMTTAVAWSHPAAGLSLWMRDVEGDETIANATLLTLIRDVFGNPFRRPVVAPEWLAAGDRAVLRLAQGIYEDRAFDRMPILADALEDAGCTDAELLAHCRAGGEHVRGCFAVDAVLGKQ